MVTTSFNQGVYLADNLRSVRAQQGVEVEHLLLDGGSTDNTARIVERFGGHLAWKRSGPDAGQAQALAEGFDRATGEVFCWLNSDDYFWDDQALARVARAFADNPGRGHGQRRLRAGQPGGRARHDGHALATLGQADALQHGRAPAVHLLAGRGLPGRGRREPRLFVLHGFRSVSAHEPGQAHAGYSLRPGGLPAAPDLQDRHLGRGVPPRDGPVPDPLRIRPPARPGGESRHHGASPRIDPGRADRPGPGARPAPAWPTPGWNPAGPTCAAAGAWPSKRLAAAARTPLCPASRVVLTARRAGPSLFPGRIAARPRRRAWRCSRPSPPPENVPCRRPWRRR